MIKKLIRKIFNFAWIPLYVLFYIGTGQGIHDFFIIDRIQSLIIFILIYFFIYAALFQFIENLFQLIMYINILYTNRLTLILYWVINLTIFILIGSVAQIALFKAVSNTYFEAITSWFLLWIVYFIIYIVFMERVLKLFCNKK